MSLKLKKSFSSIVSYLAQILFINFVILNVAVMLFNPTKLFFLACKIIQSILAESYLEFKFFHWSLFDKSKPYWIWNIPILFKKRSLVTELISQNKMLIECKYLLFIKVITWNYNDKSMGQISMRQSFADFWDVQCYLKLTTKKTSNNNMKIYFAMIHAKKNVVS